jgi:hypothetical protein
MADTTELYDITKLAFLETVALAGITISFFGNEKQCLARPIDHTLFPGDTSGYVQETSTQVDMLDTDFDEWAGIDNLSLVELDGNTLQIWGVRRKAGNPIVHIGLKKDK